jgi:hypothetical protein
VLVKKITSGWQKEVAKRRNLVIMKICSAGGAID